MPQLEDMEGFEAEIAGIMGKVLQRQLSDVMSALGNPPDYNNISPQDWTKMEADMKAAMLPELETVYLAAAEQTMNAQPIGVEWGEVTSDAAQWAESQSSLLVAGVTRTSQDVVRKKTDAFIAEGLTVTALRKSLQSAFGPVRAEMIAITEATRAAGAGDLALIDHLRQQGAEVVVVWETAMDDRVCPICGPLEGTKQGDSWTDPPPAHVRCRCWLNFRYPKTGETF